LLSHCHTYLDKMIICQFYAIQKIIGIRIIYIALPSWRRAVESLSVQKHFSTTIKLNFMKLFWNSGKRKNYVVYEGWLPSNS